MKTLIYVLGIMLCISCSSKKAGKSSNLEKINNASIEMGKGACLGRCSVYTISINEKGEVRYEGIFNVEKIGRYKKQIAKEDAEKLIRTFTEANFFEFKDEYTGSATDLPTTKISFTLNKRSKKIIDYLGAPEELKALEKLVEAIATSSEGWEKESDPQ